MLHKSSSIKLKNGKWVNNERLEFLGDAILDAIVADVVFKKYAYKKEGFLTNLRAKIVQRDTLNKFTVEIGLDKLIVTSSKAHSHNTHMYGNALEALIGAIYLDQGYRVAKKFVEQRLIQEFLDLKKVEQKEVNFKSRLIEWGQKKRVPITFDLLNTTYDKRNNLIFKTEVRVGEEKMGMGTGYSKKESQQVAAQEAITQIKANTQLEQRLIETYSEDFLSENKPNNQTDSL